MIEQERCAECGMAAPLKMGWSNEMFCSESCERSKISALHSSMPGGPSPYLGWLPTHISREISDRWEQPND